MMLKWYGGLIRLYYLDCDNGIKKKLSLNIWEVLYFYSDYL